MKVWLVTIGEPIPVGDLAKDRLHRCGYLATTLARAGHDVMWWTSTFDHFAKRHLFGQDTSLTLEHGLRVKMLHGCGYPKALSFSRILDQRQIAKKFSEQAELESPPDVIVASLPVIELCSAATKYGKRHSVPVVLDMRDMWPDIFAWVVPAALRPAAHALLAPFYLQAARACRSATAITGVTDQFVAWGAKRGLRNVSRLDRSFPLAYTVERPSEKEIAAAESYWDQQGVRRDNGRLVVSFMGAIGHAMDVATIVRAARILDQAKAPVQFVIAGQGDLLEARKRDAQGLSNVLFPGWIRKAQIYTLLRRSHLGLDPLPDRFDYVANLNNKAIECLSAGVPVLASPAHGVLADLLAREDCGLSYAHGDAAGLAGHIAALAKNPERLRRMSESATRVFDRNYRGEKVYGDMTAYLEDVAAVSQSACVQ